VPAGDPLQQPLGPRRRIKQFEEGNYADAAGSFRNALRSDPRDYKSQYYLAQSYENLKQYQQAIQAYKASLDAQPRTLAGKEDKDQRIATIKALAACISKSDNRDAEVNLIEQSAKNGTRHRTGCCWRTSTATAATPTPPSTPNNRAALADSDDFTCVKEYGLYLEQVGSNSARGSSSRRRTASTPTTSR
jgi:tetratricopeptide (TPR) repeat protein